MAELSAASEKRRVALHSVLGAVGITVLKLLTGLATGSLGILSEAAHSGLDLIAAGITFFSIRVSDKPADRDHLYGHQKVENFSAFLEIGVLLLTCFWIIYEAGRRLLGHPKQVEASAAAFGVMIASIAVDFLRSRALHKAARKHNSPALEADALHFSTDIWSSSVVILGLTLVRLGDHYQQPYLQRADPLAALGVAAIIIVISVRLARRSIEALLDAAPAGLAERIEKTLREVKGVTAIDRVRTRHAGNQYFVDANIAVERGAPFEHAKSISDAARAAIGRLLPGADVMIHTEPRAAGMESLFDTVKLVAARRRLAVHDLTAYGTDAGVLLEFHLEVGETLTLEAAHQLVSDLEAEIQREAPQVTAITTHIENEGAQVRRSLLIPEEVSAWQEPLLEVARSFPEVLDCHQISVFGPYDRPSISCHCVFRGEMP
ncbi:MAG TPA: cation diffusion facilitator family transporter, partial [Bryobacterales bacterium]|nr:cation diffusion facilitator family transporter [Bryobacterales bacterium]